MLFLVSCQSEPSNSFIWDDSHYTINDKNAEEYLSNYNFKFKDIGYGVPVFIVDGNKDIRPLTKKISFTNVENANESFGFSIFDSSLGVYNPSVDGFSLLLKVFDKIEQHGVDSLSMREKLLFSNYITSSSASEIDIYISENRRFIVAVWDKDVDSMDLYYQLEDRSKVLLSVYNKKT